MSTYKINKAKQRYNEAREKMLLSALDIVNKLNRRKQNDRNAEL